MKKLLIASSAIVGVSMLATAANAANVTAGGSYTFKVWMSGADNASDAMTFASGNYSFFVNAEKTTDSGLTFTGATHIDGKDSGVAAVWDEATAAIAGGFGTVSFSNEGGNASSMAPSATGITVSSEGIDDVIDNAGDAGVGTSDSGNTVTYTSPNISGFKAAITLGRNGGNTEIDASKESGLAEGATEFSLRDDDGIAHNANTEYTGFAFSYAIAGATIGYASGSETRGVEVKGLTTDSLNGKYEESWSGTKLSVRYATGPLTVGFSTVTKDAPEITTAGTKGDKLTGAALADKDSNETAIGVSYNYGAGTVSYVQASEDFSDKKADAKAEDLTTSIIAVKHTVSDGMNVFFEQHSGSADIDIEAGYESVSEAIIGLTISF
ncbi:MAG: porin [Alphaproteobacteria bacterium]|nr:porin [Alphaproteobacteria bacterium]